MVQSFVVCCSACRETSVSKCPLTLIIMQSLGLTFSGLGVKSLWVFVGVDFLWSLGVYTDSSWWGAALLAGFEPEPPEAPKT